MSVRWNDSETISLAGVVAELERIGKDFNGLDVFRLFKNERKRSSSAVNTEARRFVKAVQGRCYNNEANCVSSFLRRRRAAPQVGIKLQGSDHPHKMESMEREGTTHRCEVPNTSVRPRNLVSLLHQISLVEPQVAKKHPLYTQMSQNMKNVYDDRTRKGKPVKPVRQSDGSVWLEY